MFFKKIETKKSPPKVLFMRGLYDPKTKRTNSIMVGKLAFHAPIESEYEQVNGYDLPTQDEIRQYKDWYEKQAREEERSSRLAKLDNVEIHSNSLLETLSIHDELIFDQPIDHLEQLYKTIDSSRKQLKKVLKLAKEHQEKTVENEKISEPEIVITPKSVIQPIERRTRKKGNAKGVKMPSVGIKELPPNLQKGGCAIPSKGAR